MAASIRTAGKNNLLKSKTWEASANFCEKLNNIIEACNSYYGYSKQTYKRPLAERNPHILKTLKDCLDWSSNWCTASTSKQGVISVNRPPCFTDIITCITSILQLYDNLKKDYSDFELATGLCNQDSVEHTLSTARGRGGFNFNPTARQ